MRLAKIVDPQTGNIALVATASEDFLANEAFPEADEFIATEDKPDLVAAINRCQRAIFHDDLTPDTKAKLVVRMVMLEAQRDLLDGATVH